MTLFQHPLVAVDGSESSLRAAEVAIDLSALLGVSLDILSVEETLPQYVRQQLLRSLIKGEASDD